ncbi:MAG TPA: alkaline phosphatase family protein, partial [Sediminibacterium sp.]|nr:alkaline phosphatase family protein [Sediminibacterium sp.]
YPERLEANGVSWKVYQNEITTDPGFEGEEDAWLSNFGDNPLEYFTQYHAKFSPAHRAVLPKRQQQLEAGILETEAQAAAMTDGSEEKKKTLQKLEKLREALARNKKAQEMLTQEAYDRIPAREKNLHEKAFVTNRDQPDSRKLVSLKYQDKGIEREVLVPKGDVLFQFREDVTNGTLPAVSWIVAPENFSDHPSAAWYGAWYISEVLDILTKDPKVWEKTIFIITYDENDGYFDHVPPFIAPDPADKTSGFCSAQIDTGVEYVNGKAQSQGPHARENSIGLGFRVPMVIASPWSRGGWVCSEVFDHTSSLQFLEKFIAEKWKKHIPETNISDWRRTICGDLRSAFRPYHGEKIQLPESLERDEFIEGIHKAKFKNVPDNYHRLMADDIRQINRQPGLSAYMPAQEKGTRPACSIPYELYADCNCVADNIQVTMKAGNAVFGNNAAGAPFLVYASGLKGQEKMQVRSYAVTAGDELPDSWQINDFASGRYRLDLYGPNGFYRVFEGNDKEPEFFVNCSYETTSDKKHLTGNILITLLHKGAQQLSVEIKDNCYREHPRHISVGDSAATVIVPAKNSHGWYDISIRVKGHPSLHRRFAGHVETGLASQTDPFMGRMV